MTDTRRTEKNGEPVVYRDSHGAPWTLFELDWHFGIIQTAQDWRAPIDGTCSALELPGALAAIVFYTATEGTAKRLDDGNYRVTATGYRNGPAGP